MANTAGSRFVPLDPVETPFSVFLWGGKEKFQRRKVVHQALSKNPIFSKNTVALPSLARKDVWTRTAFQASELIRLKLEHGWSHTHFQEAIRLTDNFLPVS